MARARLSVKQDGDGWLAQIAGWEGVRIRLTAGVVDGAPRATSLVIEPADASNPVALTTALVRTLPLTDLATMALAASNTAPAIGNLRAAVRRAAREKPEKHDPRALVSVQEVAAVWHAAPYKKQRAILTAFPGMSARTADNYIARGRATLDADGLPLIPASRPRTKTPDANSASGKRKKETR